MGTIDQESITLDTRPLFDRALEALLALIESASYQPGDRLPPEEELAQRLGISRSTLREAIRSLETRGMITRRRGIGTFLAGPGAGYLQGGLEHLESIKSLAARLGIAVEREGWQVSLVPASDSLAKALEKEPGDSLVRCEMNATLDGQVFAFMDGYIPHGLADEDELQGFEKGSLLDYLIEEGRLRLSYTRTEVFAVEADPSIAARLGVIEGTALLHLRETYFIESGSPVVHSENYFITRSFNFQIYRRVLR